MVYEQLTRKCLTLSLCKKQQKYCSAFKILNLSNNTKFFGFIQKFLFIHFGLIIHFHFILSYLFTYLCLLGDLLLLWGCILIGVTGELYKTALPLWQWKIIWKLARKLKIGHKWIFQMYNKPRHAYKVVVKWAKYNKFKVWKWLSQSTYLIPIENMWAEIKNMSK